MKILLTILLLLSSGVWANPDMNDDDMVTVSDFLMFRPMLNTDNPAGDFNCDGLNTVTDFLILRNGLNKPPYPRKLVWDAPTENEDGTTLTDLKGYSVVCAGNGYKWIDKAETEYIFPRNWHGAKWCYVLSVDENDNVSAASEVVGFCS